MKKLVSRISDLELERILDKGQGLSAVLFLDLGSVPCDYFRPEFEKFAGKMRAVHCVEIVCQENPTITERLGVMAVPTTLIFRAGKEVGRYEGPYSTAALIDRVTPLLKAAP